MSQRCRFKVGTRLLLWCRKTTSEIHGNSIPCRLGGHSPIDANLARCIVNPLTTCAVYSRVVREKTTKTTTTKVAARKNWSRGLSTHCERKHTHVGNFGAGFPMSGVCARITAVGPDGVSVLPGAFQPLTHAVSTEERSIKPSADAA